MTNLHIIETKEVHNSTVMVVELNGKALKLDSETVLAIMAQATTVTYNVENEKTISEEIKLDYSEIATEDDGYDVYVHYFNMYDGEITRKSVSGRFIKTYKTLKGATNKASELSRIVVK
jgi:hypothetical protein